MFNRKQVLTTILVCLGIISIIGIIFIGSVTQPEAEYSTGNKFAYLQTYIKYIIVGLILAGITYKAYSYESIRKFLYIRQVEIIMALLIMLFLILPIFLGVSVNGARRWIRIGSFQMQPSELVKPILILLVSQIMYGFKRKRDEEFTFYYWAGITIISVFIVILQKSKTSAIQLAAICYLIFAVSKFRENVKVTIGFSGFFVGVIVLIFKRDYSTTRLTNFAGKGMPLQVKAAIDAVKAGGILGRGIGNGYQKYFYLPEAHNDYIFASICEEGGLIFALLIIILFIVLCATMFYVASKMKESINRYVVYGVAFSIANQALLNIAINLNCAPSTGITLPFISYGGSSYISNAICMGLLFSAINIEYTKRGQ